MAQVIITSVSEDDNFKEYRNQPWRKERKSSDVIYVWIEGENVLENLQNRRSRPSKAYKKFVLPLGLKEAGYSDEAAKEIIKKAYWSQRAGCSCGCSPGFLTKGLKMGRLDINFKATLEIHELCPEGPTV